MYILFKHLHLTTVALSLLGFVLRLLWRLMDSPLTKKKLVKVLPHVNDTILLLSGIVLVWYLGLYPWEQGWLAAKLIGLLCYIYLGAKALKGQSVGQKLGYGVIALAVFGYIVTVAITKTPFPWA